MELKPANQDTTIIFSNYQSYQSGIETVNCFSTVYLNLFYQSYQSGIETLQFACPAILWYLPIVPKWNWNNWYGVWLCRWWGATNRTKVELKLEASKWNAKFQIAYQSYQSGIETMEGVGRHLFFENYQSYQSGIETKEVPDAIITVNALPIVPKWNWNCGLPCVPFPPVCDYQSYQSGIETIQLWFQRPASRLYQSYQSGIETSGTFTIEAPPALPIVPKWNWNGAAPMFTHRYLHSTNRTKVELKRLSIAAFKLISDYQSYQSGIETSKQRC